jgi:hypothetical protein
MRSSFYSYICRHIDQTFISGHSIQFSMWPMMSNTRVAGASSALPAHRRQAAGSASGHTLPSAPALAPPPRFVSKPRSHQHRANLLRLASAPAAEHGAFFSGGRHPPPPMSSVCCSGKGASGNALNFFFLSICCEKSLISPT